MKQTSAPSLSIYLLGGIDVIHNHQSVSVDTFQSLLAYIVLKARSPQPRSQVAALFWPDLSDKGAKAKLRRELYRLRQILPDDDRYLAVTTKTVQWRPQPNVWLDVAEFEQAIAEAAEQTNPYDQIQSLKQAVELYQGDLLPSCYDDWIGPERDRLHQCMVDTLCTLIALLTERGDLLEAIPYGKQLLTFEPLSDKSYVTLMQLYAQQGDRASALQLYHQCMTVLSEELGVDPSSTTRQLYEQLLLEDVAPTQKTSTQSKAISDLPPAESETLPASRFQIDWGEAPDIQFFYGRNPELETLRAWIIQVRSRLIAVLGMGGIGKTALVAKVAHELQSDFDYVIWRSLRNAPPLESLLGELIPFLSEQQDNACTVVRLMHWLRQSRCLVILDNLETLLDAKDRAGQFHAAYSDYCELIEVIAQGNHQSCIVLTSREKPAEIASIETVNPLVESIQLSGSPEAAIALLDAKSLTGTSAQKAELCAKYGHSPLALQIVGGSIRDIFSGDISLFFEEDTLLFNGAKKLLDVQFDRLIPLERSVMFWLAINREWTSLTELMADIHPYCAKRQLLEVIESLSWRSLIERRANTYTQQPVVMEYVTTVLLTEIGQELADPHCFDSNDLHDAYLVNYALMQTTGPDYIRESQERVLIQPLIEELNGLNCDPQRLILNHLKAFRPLDTPNYAVGNLMNLGRSLQVDFTGLDLSAQFVRQAFLRDVTLNHVNFENTQFQQTVFTQPAGPIFDVAFNHDGSLLAASEGDGRLVVWCTQTYQPKLTLKESSTWLLSLTFNYDGSRLVSEGHRNTLCIWDVNLGGCIQKLEGHEADIWEINAHPTEDLIVSASADGSAGLWNIMTGERLYQWNCSSIAVRAAAFSADGAIVACGTEDGRLHLWAVKTGDHLHEWQRSGSILSLGCSPDGQHIAVGNHLGEIELWNIKTESASQFFLAHEGPVMTVKFSPCGCYLASGSYRETKLWDVSTGKLLRTANSYTSWIWGLAFSPDGQFLAVGNHDHIVRLWELPHKRLLRSLPGLSSWITALQCHPVQPLLASCSNDGTTRLWDLHSGKTHAVLEGHQDWVVGVDFSPCGEFVVTSSNDQTIKLWAVETGQLLKTFEGHVSPVYGIRFSPDGTCLVSSGLDLTLRLWDIASGKLLQLLERPLIEGHHGWILAVQFNPNQKYFATGGSDALINLWDADTGKHLKSWQAHSEAIWAICFHPSGQHLVSVGEDATINVWDMEQGTLLKSLEAHTDTIYAASYSPDGRWLVTAGEDLSIKVWDAKTYTLVKSLQYHQARVTTLAFMPDSQFFGSGSIDELIAIWDVGADQPNLTLRAPRPYESMNISGVKGLTNAQIPALKSLGAYDNG